MRGGRETGEEGEGLRPEGRGGQGGAGRRMKWFLPLESYTQRDVRLHVERLKDLLSTDPLHQSVLCKDGITLSFVSAVTLLDPEGEWVWHSPQCCMHVAGMHVTCMWPGNM